jgi:hypothetical protein
MESGMYLELNSPENCRLYGPGGEFLKDVKIEGKIPVINNGDNNISFKCKETDGVSTRFQVTVITEGASINR